MWAGSTQPFIPKSELSEALAESLYSLRTDQVISPKVGKLSELPTPQDPLHLTLCASLLRAETSQLECSSWLAAPRFCPHCP